MSNPQTNAVRLKHVCATAVAAGRNILVWFTGLPGDAVMRHRLDVQMRYTAAGLLVLVWFAFMLLAWVKTGAYFFGTAGGFAFSLIPSIMLAVDRMILGQFRNPDGALSAYALDELKTKRWEYALRALAALVFSAVTTQVFLITYAAPDIRAHQQREQEKANAPLRAEIAGRVQAQADERLRSIAARSTELEAQSTLLKEEHALARKTAEEAENRANSAQVSVAVEAGGINGRARGRGPRHDAYASIASQSRDVAVNARARENRAREALGKVLVELQQLNAEREKAIADRNVGMANLDAELQEDARFVRRKQGLLSDSTTLIRLYGDKDVGPGLLTTCLLTAAFLFILEMSPLLGLAFLPTTPVDVERIALNRADAARVIAEHEIELMQSASRRGVHVHPVQEGSDPSPAHARANESEAQQ